MSAPTFRFDDPTDARRMAAFAATHAIAAAVYATAVAILYVEVRDGR